MSKTNRKEHKEPVSPAPAASGSASWPGLVWLVWPVPEFCGLFMVTVRGDGLEDSAWICGVSGRIWVTHFLCLGFSMWTRRLWSRRNPTLTFGLVFPWERLEGELMKGDTLNGLRVGPFTGLLADIPIALTRPVTTDLCHMQI